MPAGVMDVSAAAYAELKARFEACGILTERLIKMNDQQTPGTVVEVLNLNNLALRPETDDQVGVWLIIDGKRVNKPTKKHGKLLRPKTEGT